MAVGKMRNCRMWKAKCGMKTVEMCCGMVGKMCNAEICHVWAIVCRREEQLIPMNGSVLYVSC